ncbi:MAG: hypothetical protein IIU76_01545 [Bacteroidales bacterium]|nr:hypothetical protein [Bacteroidales bacterium]
MDNIKFSTDEIRTFNGFEGLTDEQAGELADFLTMYAIIVYDRMKEYGRD